MSLPENVVRKELVSVLHDPTSFPFEGDDVPLVLELRYDARMFEYPNLFRDRAYIF